MGDNRDIIMTVCGPIDPGECGITSCHEHVILDPGGATLTDVNYDLVMYDVDLQIEELEHFRAAGGQTIVSMTNIGIGRDPAALKRVSEGSGVHIVMPTGWYQASTYPPYIEEKMPDDLADLLVQDIVEGVDGSGIRAGIIGEVGTGRNYIRPDEERVFRAAARAQRRTGVALYTHTTHFGELALEQIALLEEEGVDLDRVVIGHLGDRQGIDMLLPIASRGVWLGIDNIGWLSYARDERRVQNLCELAEAGYLDRILLGTDICLNSSLRYYGGRGYAHLLDTFRPLLRDAGFSETEIQAMLVDNPRKMLSMRRL